MKIPRLAIAMSCIDDDLIAAAETYRPDIRKRPIPAKVCAAAAACIIFAVIISMVLQKSMISSPIGNSSTESSTTTGSIAGVGQMHILSVPETIRVELVEWQVDRFTAVVTDPDRAGIFPAGAELNVRFDEDTTIVLQNGDTFHFNPDEPDTNGIGWQPGDTILVEFTEYEDYQEGNHFYNQLTADHAELCE